MAKRIKKELYPAQSENKWLRNPQLLRMQIVLKKSPILSKEWKTVAVFVN
jgi:hypothetical protein